MFRRLTKSAARRNVESERFHMKTTALLLSALSLAAVSTFAQTNQVEIRQGPATVTEAPIISADKVARYVRFQTEVVNRAFGISVTYSGVVPMISRTDNPLQLINPFAPARYGNGFDNVSVNPTTGRVEGINLFAIKF